MESSVILKDIAVFVLGLMIHSFSHGNSTVSIFIRLNQVTHMQDIYSVVQAHHFFIMFCVHTLWTVLISL